MSDGRVVKRIEHREEAFAGNGEDAVAAVDAQLIDEDSSAGACGHEVTNTFTPLERHPRESGGPAAL